MIKSPRQIIRNIELQKQQILDDIVRTIAVRLEIFYSGVPVEIDLSQYDLSLEDTKHMVSRFERAGWVVTKINRNLYSFGEKL